MELRNKEFLNLRLVVEVTFKGEVLVKQFWL